MRLILFRNIACLIVVLAAGWGLAGGAFVRAQAPGSPDPRLLHYADTIVVGGKIVTLDDPSTIQEALAIRDGKFLAVGASADMRRLAGPSTRVIDAGGRTVLPGLIDTHVHLIQAAAFWRDEIRVDEARSLEDIFAAIRARAAAVPPGTWILIRGGWHYSQIRERRMPTRAELDAVAPDHPVHVQSTYEVVQLNSRGIAASGITGRTELPPGGSMEKDAQGNFTGVLRGTRGVLMGREKYFPRLSVEEKVAALRAVMREFNAAGLTGIIDGNGLSIIEHWLDRDEDYQAIFELWRRGQMTLRVGLQLDSRDEAQALDVLDRFPARLGDDMFWVGSVGENLMLDVWNPANYPLPPATRAAFKRVVEAAVARNATMQIHSQTELQLNTMLDVFEEVHARTPLNHLRFTLLHAELLTPAMIERMKRLGMGVMIQARQLVTADVLQKTWGARMDDAPIVKTVFESGLPLGGGTDGTVAVPFRPFMALYWYVSGRSWRGDLVRPTQRLTREQALQVYTRQAAWFSFHEDRRGAIAPGFLADLIVLDKDYLTVPEQEIPTIRPVMTIVGGKVVFER
jgi:predicted amidohydrolase YtcJ